MAHNRPMLELWKWFYLDPVRKRRVKTRYACTEEEARKRYGPDVERAPGTMEVRQDGDPAVNPGFMSKL